MFTMEMKLKFYYLDERDTNFSGFRSAVLFGLTENNEA